MVIQHNLSAMSATRQNKIVGQGVKKSTEKLSSGYQINRAADNAAGLSISEKMRYQIRGLTRGAENIQEGIHYCQVADGALNEVTEMLQRINELAVQAANGTNSEIDRSYIDTEVELIKNEIDRICMTTKFNDIYLFKCDTLRDSFDSSVYTLRYDGYPADMYIYNDTYDAATGTATYGGIAYKGKRYAWADISPNMYNSQTGEFNAGTYTLRADDGACLTMQCEQGSKPPQVSREYTTHADVNGISVNGELIKWDQVWDSNGNAFNPNQIEAGTHSFQYHGVTVSFDVEPEDSFSAIVSKLSGTRWRSNYRIPYEETALSADFSKSYFAFMNGKEVNSYLTNHVIDPDKDYTLRAGNGENQTFDGIWLELDGNIVAGSQKSWNDIGITNWGDQSEDIWSDKVYHYSFGRQQDVTDFSFSFQVVNEISKDSVIDALDGVKVFENMAVDKKSHVAADFAQNSNILSAKLIRDNLHLTLAEEYGLGRDYTTVSHTYGNSKVQFNTGNDQISTSYTNTIDGVTTTKNYSNTKSETDKIANDIKNTIKDNLKDYLKLFRARYLAGAADPSNINLAALISPGNITGGGSDTYLEDAYQFDFTRLKTTLSNREQYYAGAKIDFSGLGTAYQLADLVGMGFNSTCQTCSNHYSIQFMTKEALDSNTNWSSMTDANGNTFDYSMGSQGGNYTLYIDVGSMQGIINNGVDFTNALVDILDASKFDFHFTQYATYTDQAELYVVDYRGQYADGGTSSATNADFSPYAYGTDTTVNFTINLYDENNSAENVGLSYQYDYKNLFQTDKLYFDAEKNPNGDYVYNAATQKYEKYDAAIHGTSVDRYNIKDITLETGGKTLDEYLEDYAKNTILAEASSSTTLKLVNDYTRYKVSANINDNAAMITQYNTPYQIMPTKMFRIEDESKSIRIQCSSNVEDFLKIPRYKLSTQRLGIKKLSMKTEDMATNAMDLVSNALEKVNTIRSSLGAYQNRLEHSYAANLNTCENTQFAEAVIRDTDMAEEMVKYSNANILSQAGQAIIAQANQNRERILSLIA